METFPTAVLMMMPEGTEGLLHKSTGMQRHEEQDAHASFPKQGKCPRHKEKCVTEALQYLYSKDDEDDEDGLVLLICKPWHR